MPKKWPLFCAKMKRSAMHKTKDAFWVSWNAWLAAFDLLYYRAALRKHDGINALNDINETNHGVLLNIKCISYR